jgi:DNA repair exonuclease SbcCD nuclease subunit
MGPVGTARCRGSSRRDSCSHSRQVARPIADDVRVLLLADSHLGFDLPVRPRVDRRRRGHDFLANYAAALQPALAGEVDVVVHAGDVFDRSKIDPTLAYQAFEPLRQVADRGIPVFIVPGNHERSRLPHLRFASHAGVHVFDEPRTFHTEVRGTRIAIAGFPYEQDVRARFADLLAVTGWRSSDAALRLLCIHQCVEGATVGPADYTFTTAADVVRIRDVPSEFAAVFAGHIHRHQVLTTDLARRPVSTPVLYPGSPERTTFAEAGETKGFMVVRIGVDAGATKARVAWEFRELPARPMVRGEIAVEGMSETALAIAVEDVIAAAPADAVLSIRLTGVPSEAQWRVVSSARLREVAPRTMNVEVVPAGAFTPRAP